MGESSYRCNCGDLMRAWSRDTAVARLVTAGIVQSWPTAGGDQEWALHWQYVLGR